MAFIMFISGLLSGYFIQIKHNEFNEAKMERMKELLEMDESEEYYFHEDSMGQVWQIGPGECTQVF
jgi:hypothetical protein